MVWSSLTGTEEPVATANSPWIVYDWSPDGQALLASLETRNPYRVEVWWVPLAAAPHAETESRKIISSPEYENFQPHFSPDGRWIVFQAHSTSRAESRLYVMRATGGPWIPITQGSGTANPAGRPMERRSTSSR